MNVFKKNLITSTDSYKVGHYMMLPTGNTHSSYYIEARSEGDELIAGGMNYVAKVLEQGITLEDVERANSLFKNHFGRDVMNYDGWMKIINEFDGKLPIRLIAAPEGMLVPSKNVLAVVENTHPAFGWLPSYLETFILRSVWYWTTVASKSYKFRSVIEKYIDETTDLEGGEREFAIKTQIHDFGSRSSTSGESAGIGGVNHLYSFIGTDTVEALVLAQDLFLADCAGISVPATEHSVTYSWSHEDLSYANVIKMFGTGVYSMVLDSTDFVAALDRLCTDMKKSIEDQGGKCVVRLDSGHPVDNVIHSLETLGKYFGYTTNSKGFRVLNPIVGVLQGDSISEPDDVERILSWMAAKGWASSNVVFGVGSGIHQKLDRDTFKFAMKLSAIKVDGNWFACAKTPKDAPWKTSKKGVLRLVKEDGKFKTINILEEQGDTVMKEYYVDGKIQLDSLEEIRNRVDNK